MEYSNWYFGFKTGIKFEDSKHSIIKNSELESDEGCSSISDSLGNLLFYTNGVNVWNRNNQLMSNGLQLYGNTSSSQSALILKKPNSRYLYYIFTCDKTPIVSPHKDSGIRYSIIDMSLDNGLGGVIEKNVKIANQSSEKLTATWHANHKDFWISTLKRKSDSVFVFLLNDKGLSKSIGYRNSGKMVGEFNFFTCIGQMKFSQDGKSLAYVNQGNSCSIHLLSFNNQTGELSNSRNISNVPCSPYGIEFSPNGKLLYFSIHQKNTLYQVEVDSISFNSDFNKVSKLIYQYDNNQSVGSLQLGLNNKIYVSLYKGNALGVIDEPNELGLSCKFVKEGILLENRLSGYGLPFCLYRKDKIAIRLINKKLCIGDTAFFDLSQMDDYDSIHWIINGLLSKNHRLTKQFDFKISDTGVFTIDVIAFLKNGMQLQSSKQFSINSVPKPDFGVDRSLCSYEVLKGAYADTYFWSTDEQSQLIEVSSPGIYWLFSTYKNCSRLDSITFKTCDSISFFVPNAFTPNGDGLNDVFAVSGNNIFSIKMTVFNSWGELVYSSDGKDYAWNGQYKSVDCQQGVYFYQMEVLGFNNKRYYQSGTVSLLR